MIRTHNASALFDYWSQAFQFFLKKTRLGVTILKMLSNCFL